MLSDVIKSALIKREIWLARREAQQRLTKRRVARDHCTRCLEHYDNCACDDHKEEKTR